MTTFAIFQTECEVYSPPGAPPFTQPPEDPIAIAPRAMLRLSVELDGADRDKITFRIERKGDTGFVTVRHLDLPLTDAHPFAEASATLAIGESIALDLNLADEADRARFRDCGLVGLALETPPEGMDPRLSTAARLDRVRIVLRPSRPDGSWTGRQPFFCLFTCWTLQGRATAGAEVLQGGDKVTLAANATAEISVCAGLACIHPPELSLGLPSLQTRIDFDSFGFTTGWLSFSWIDFGGISEIHLNGLGRWFAELVGALPDLSDVFDGIELPSWDVDLPLNIDLPFGLSVKEASFRLTQQQGGYTVRARAVGLVLRWNDVETELDDPALDLELVRDTEGKWRYRFDLRLFEWVYPESGQSGSREIALPLDLLGIWAVCWRLRLGLHSSGNSSDPGVLCVETMLEIGDLRVFSRLLGGRDEPFHTTDLRLIMRNFQVMIEVPTGETAPGFFAGLTHPVFAPFRAAYDALEPNVKKLTFAKDLDAPPDTDPANEYGIEFVDGDLRKGERLYVAWHQRGDQFLRALMHDLFTTPPAGEVPDDARRLSAGLEIAWFEDDDVQVRLDWIDEVPDPPGAGTVRPPAIWTDTTEPPGKKLTFADLASGDLVLPPGASKGVALSQPADALTLDLPGVRLGVARPLAKSIVFRRAGGTDEASFLLFYGSANPVADQVPLIAKAELGFALDSGEAGREVMGTSDVGGTQDAFMTLGLGYGGSTETAVRMIGWQSGQSPKFFQAYGVDAPPIRTIAPPSTASAQAVPACPALRPTPLPAVALGDEAFESLSFVSDRWQLALRFADASSVLDLFGGTGSAVKITIREIIKPDDADHLLIVTDITIDLPEGFTATGSVRFRFDSSDFGLSIERGGQLAIRAAVTLAPPPWAGRVPLPEVPEGRTRYWADIPDILGLEAWVYADLPNANGTPQQIDVLTLTIDSGRLVMALPEANDLVLRYAGLAPDSLTFLAEEFSIGPGGVDLSSRLLGSTLSVKGLKKPFALEQAQLVVRQSQLRTLSISASGNLPELLDEAPVELTITFKQESRDGGIELDELICRLGDEDEPIFSRGTRFKFEISRLDLRYVRQSKADRHFFFEVTGSAQFTPDEGEFKDGLLEDLKSAKIEFVRAPLTEEFTQHLSLSVELTEPRDFDVFDIFRMEIRSIGFHPNFQGFEEAGPALIIGGQVEFADLGDVPSVEIDFHSMYIGLPKPGEAVPQVHFDGLRVEISSPDGFRIAGRVDRYDDPLHTGFAGEGTVYIPGFPELSAAFAFVRIRADENDPWQRAWFIAVEASKISYQIPPLPIYLRQIGMGFGYRHTLPIISTLEQQATLRSLISQMLEALNRHQTLARIDSWKPVPNPQGKSALWTIALEAVISLGTSQAAPFDYQSKKEQKLKTIFAQIFAAIRSDFTLISAAKVWYPVSVDDFFNNEEGMRGRPLASGFMIYSAPQRRFLSHATKGSNPYLGKPNDPVPAQVARILDQSHYEATLLIEPGLLHAELGWPDRLFFGMQVGSVQLECRGGAMLRVENDALIQGIFFSARGSMDLAGGISLGFVGMRVSAHVSIYFAARLMTALYLSRPLGSRIYAQVGLDVAVRFRVEAWLRLKIGFVKINISISFSVTLQIVVGLELGWAGGADLGFRGRATVVIGVFGRSLRASVSVGLNEGGVEAARAALAPYMGPFLEPGQAPHVPDGNLLNARAALKDGAGPVDSMAESATAPTFDNSEEVQPERLVTAYVLGADGKTYVWIMPGPGSEHFYPVVRTAPGTNPHAYATISGLEGGFEVIDFGSRTWRTSSDGRIPARHGKEMELSGEGGTTQLSLAEILAGCHVIDADDWVASGRQFPEGWYEEANPADRPNLMPVRPDEPMPAMRDPRPLDPEDPARGPSRRLDPRSAFDREIAEALKINAENPDGGGDIDCFLEEQARGNQSFVLQSFYDDLVKLAAGGNQALNAMLDEKRPTVADLGMVIRLDGAPPDWVRRRDAANYPSVRFEEVMDSTVGEDPRAPMDLRPVVDFDASDFSQRAPVFNETAIYFDEEVLALRWRLDWGGGTPDHATGVDIDIESFVQAYSLKFTDLKTLKLIKTMTVKPADLLVPGADGTVRRRLRPRFQVSVPLDELFGDEVNQGQTLRGIAVAVTPVDQSGRPGNQQPFIIYQEPSLTPLPADSAECLLARRDKDSTDDGRISSYVAELSWRQLSVPPRPGISATDRWQLVLRPLRRVPMGAFPDDAIEPTDRGLMSATGQNLMEGDLVLRLPTDRNLWDEPDDENDPDKSLDPADRIYRLVLDPSAPLNPPPTSESDEPYAPYDGWALYDHLGNAVRSGPQIEDVRSFLMGISAADAAASGRPAGKGWRLFLRAETQARQGLDGRHRQPTVSGMMPVRLIAQLAVGAVTESAEMPPPLRRPLPHFEWPTRELAEDDRTIRHPRATAGGLHIPLLSFDGDDSPVLTFMPEPSRARAITLEWSAIQKPADESRPVPTYEAISEYRVFETPVDALLNVDLYPDTDFAPPWRQIARVHPADPDIARQTPDSMADTQNWVAWTPAYAATLRWLDSQRVPDGELRRRWPGWHSWAESHLVWPDPETQLEGKLMAISAAEEQGPLEVLEGLETTFDAAVREVRATPPGELKYGDRYLVGADATDAWTDHRNEIATWVPGASEGGEWRFDAVTRGSTVLIESERLVRMFVGSDIFDGSDWIGPALRRLAAWRDLGEQAAGRRMHFYLCLLVGRLTDVRGFDGSPEFTVQANTGQPVQIADAATWLKTNNAGNDPYGWAALGHLGLNVAIALRDRTSGLLRRQRLVRNELDAAVAKIDETVRLIPSQGTNVDTRVLDRIAQHLARDYPIQTAWAARATRSGAELDEADLAMVQVNLRPISEIQYGYSVAKFIQMPAEPLPVHHKIRLFFLDGARATIAVHPEEGQVSLDFLRPGQRVLIQHMEPNKAADDLGWDPSLVELADDPIRENGVYGPGPLPLKREAGAGDITPFGRFEIAGNVWHDRFFEYSEPNNVKTRIVVDDQLCRALYLIAMAFGRIDSDDNSGGRKTPAEVQTELERNAKLHLLYLDWSARFHETAPLQGGLDLLHVKAVRETLTAPKLAEPLALAADRAGILRMTRLVEEEWASTRSFALTAVGRYDRLVASLGSESAPVAVPSLLPEHRADVHLPRIRRVEPPQALGQRAIQDTTGRWFNELTVATHSEEALANSNIQLARKLDFGVTMRRYVRTFRDVAWFLAMKDVLDPGPVLPNSDTPRLAAEPLLPDLDAARLDYLAHVPKARWGASRYVTPAEPFYYDTRVDVMATGGLEQSEQKVLPLDQSLPVPAVPWGDPPYGYAELEWENVLDPVPGLTHWGNLPDPIKAYAKPDGLMLGIRLPRYVESLPGDSVQAPHAYYRAELAENGVGLLPDPHLVLHVVRDLKIGASGASALGSAPPARQTVMTISSSLPAGDAIETSDLFERTNLVPDFDHEELSIDSSAWQDGLWLKTPIYRRAVRTTLDLTAATDVVAVPDRLEMSSTDPLAGEILPSNGPLAQLAPLAMRMEWNDTTSLMSTRHMMAGPDWLTRPSRPMAESGEAFGKPDLALGLRLVVDWPRRRAAALVAYDILMAEQSSKSVGALRRLLRDIELADAVYLADVNPNFEVDSSLIDRLTEHGIVIWSRANSGWTRIDTTVSGEERHIMAVGRMLDPGRQSEFVDLFRVAVDLGIEHSDLPPNPEQQIALTPLLWKLADTVHVGARVAPPDIYTQRGNGPRALWAQGRSDK